MKRELKKFLSSPDTEHLNTREKAAIFKAAYFPDDESLMTAWYKSVKKAFTTSERKELVRENQEYVFNQLKHSQSGNDGYPIVFYCCTEHSNPSSMHKNYQGKMYVDYFWRKKLESVGAGEWLIKSVETFINKNNVMSVQQVSSYPILLCTRAYCKHQFVPVPTLSALTQSTDTFVKRYRSYRISRNDTDNYINKMLQKKKAHS